LALWWLTLLVGIGILVASLPTYALYFQGVNVLIPDAPSSPFAILSGLASLFTAVTCLALAGVLFRRKRNERMALFVSFYLIAYGIVMAGPIEFLDGVLPGAAETAVRLIQPVFLGVPTIVLLVLFPDGRPVPRWTRWLIPVAALSLIFLPWAEAGQAPYRLPSGAETITWLLMGTTMAAAIYGQVYRYRRVSSPSERLQTKWVLAGFVAWFVLILIQAVPYAYLGSLPPGTPIPAWATGSASLWFIALAIVPVCLTISILRYRLYDIDLIINRALVYGGLTAVLAGVYTASIGLSQRVFMAVTGEQSDAAIVLTTLVVASAFTPVRTWLQAAVDRRFKDVHDPARRLSALAEEITHGIWVLHPQQAAARLLTEAADAFGAVGGAAYWRRGRRDEEVCRVGEWNPPGVLTADLTAAGRTLGSISLGPRRDRSAYSAEDRRAFNQAAEAVARAFLGSPLARTSAASASRRQPRRPSRKRARA
jgi:hypothetical protein